MRYLTDKLQLKKSLPFITTLIIVICFAIAINNEMNYERSALKASAKQEMLIAAAKLESLFAQSIETTLGLKSYFEENPDFDNPELVSFTKRLFGENQRIIRTFALTDKGTIKYIYPLKGNESTLEVDLLSLPDQKETVRKTLEKGNTSLTGPIKVIQGWEAFIFMVALNLTESSDGPSEGLITVTLDHNELLAESGIINLLNKYEVQLVRINTDFSEQIIFKSNQFHDEDSVVVEIFPYNQHWQLLIYPINGWQTRSAVILTMIIAGVVISSGTYYLLYSLLRRNEQLDQLVASRTKDLVWTNSELHESLALNEERQAELELLNGQLEMTIVELKYTMQKLNATEKSRVISDLIAGVAHRMNTPIGNILSMVSFVKSKITEYYNASHSSQIGEPKNELISTIEECITLIDMSTAKAIGIMSSFNNLSSLKFESDFECFNLSTCIDETVSKLFPVTSMDVQNDMNREFEIYASKTMLMQIFYNILRVIIEYHSNEVTTTIQIEGHSINGLCVLNIHVMPFEFPKEIIEKTFDPHLFIPANSELTGLELLIAFQLASEVLGGDLKFSILSNTESQFTLYVPETCNKE